MLLCRSRGSLTIHSSRFCFGRIFLGVYKRLRIGFQMKDYEVNKGYEANIVLVFVAALPR